MPYLHLSLGVNKAFLFRGFQMDQHNSTSLRISYSKSGTVFLQLFDRKRNIGSISADGQTYTKSINPSLHIHRKTNSIGFNNDLLRSGSFHWVTVKADGYSPLVTSRQYILEKGFFLHFKADGYEKQIFLPVTEFGIDKARQFESCRSNQQNLFGEVA